MNKKISTSLVASFFIATNLYSAQDLEPITITSATKSEQSIKDVTSNVDIITKEELEERHFTDLTQALNTLAGVSFTSNGGLGQTTSVYLRGHDSKRTLVLIDGIRYNDVTGLNGASFENIMLDDVEQIEVIKGAQSGIWGADASAGVINIITKKAKKGTTANAKVEYGSYKTKKYGLNLSHKTDDFYIQGSVNKLQSDGFSAYMPRGKDISDYKDDGYENLTSSIKAGYNFNDSNKIDLEHKIIDSEVDFDDFGAEANNISKNKSKFSTVKYQNKNSFATTQIYASKSSFDREYYFSSFNSISNYDGDVKEYGIKSNLPYLNNSSNFIVGADYKQFKHKNSINEKYNNKAVFITNINKFNNDNTIFTQSLRTDRYDKFENKTSGKIGLKHYFLKDLSASTNYGTAYNVPTLYNLFDGFSGNKDLKPENTKAFDIGIEYKGLNITYFDTKVKDMIDYDFSTFKYANLQGTSRLKGYEVKYAKDIFKDTLLSLNYTHLNAKNSQKQDLGRRGKNKVGFALDYYGIKDLHLNLNGSYIGTRYNLNDKQGTSTGNYTLWNSVVNYDINKNFKAYLKVDNIFDKNYQVVDRYATARRSAYVGLKASF